MTTFLSLQGCMAVGKTTAARLVQQRMPGVTVSYECPAPVLAEIKARQLDKSSIAGFAETQRLFISAELERWRSLQGERVVLFDFGPEEIEFYTTQYPASVGVDWDMENMLRADLAALRQCRPTGILFLDAPGDVLRSRKQQDATRGRGSFEHYVKNMLPLKRHWLLNQQETTVLDTGGLSPEEVGQRVCDWVSGFLK